MKLSFWNWLHLSVPYAIALFCYYNWEETFLGWLFLGYFLTEMITMAPYMDREVKTGRSFNTKYGRIEEYQTVKGESGNDMENMTGKIHVVHFSGMILIIIYAIYSLFSSINADKSNTTDVEILNSNNREINNQVNESEIELIPEANDTLSKDKLIDGTYFAENISDSATTVSEADEVLPEIDKSANKIYNKYDVDIIPEPIGGIENLMKIIKDKFPQKPRMYKNFSNYISFVVEKDGSLSDLNIISTGELDVSKEILKYLKTSTKWNSGEINSEKVRVEYGLETN